MSRLRKQLLKLLPELSKQAKSLKSKDAKSRWKTLQYIIKSRNTVKKACIKMGCSEEWFRKWAHRVIKAKQVGVLKGKSRKPKKSPRKLKPLWEKRILLARDNRPFEGPERIAQKLVDVYGKKISASGVHNVLCRNERIDRKQEKKRTKKHMKRYRRALPGYLQIDFKYVPYKITGQQFYQLSCVDHHSSWRLIRYYPNKDIASVESFLIELIQQCPFPIIQIQTDNDLAFTHKFWKLHMGFDPTNTHPLEDWCKEHGIEHRLIPVGEKELNGKVENTHKQDDREFFSQINPQNLTHLQALGLAYEDRWNGVRKTKALQWLTPNQTIERAFVKALVWFKLLGLPWPTNVLHIPRHRPKKIKRPKRKSYLDRYLKWMEEDVKKYGTNG